MLAEKIQGTWKIIAFGGAGYDYYGRARRHEFRLLGLQPQRDLRLLRADRRVGQVSELLRPAKRAAYFVQSFSDLFTGSHNDFSLAKADSSEVHVTSRTNPTGGSFILLDRFGKKKSEGGAEIAPSASTYTSGAAAIQGCGLDPHHRGIAGPAAPERVSGRVARAAHGAAESAVDGEGLVRVDLHQRAAEALARHDRLLGRLRRAGDVGEVTLQPKDGAAKTFSFTYPPTTRCRKSISIPAMGGRRNSW